MTSEFTMEKVEKISKDANFIKEFLSLSYTSLLEAKSIFKTAICSRNIMAYRQIAHKIKSNLLLLGLSQFHALIVSGKELFEHSDDDQLLSFYDVLEINFNNIIEKVNILMRQYDDSVTG